MAPWRPYTSKVHKEWAKNVSSRLFTCFHYIHKKKTAPPPGGHAKNVTSRVKKTPPGGHVFLPIQTISELNSRIQKTNVLIKFHEDWAKYVSYRLFTCYHYIHIEQTAPLHGGHVFPPIMTIFELANNVTSRVIMTPHSGGHVFSPIRTIFELNRHIEKTHGLIKFHYIHIEKTAPPLGGHISMKPMFDQVSRWAIIVTSRVFTRNTAPPPGGHVFQWTETIFKLYQHII
ncbi:hypothetical protein DPMN_066243 [Dreissena polymorpha]|uniref:Uncharacterized protein n=1 Tax=Dreissena polymorpha TaxID=45954 RepID=A0A9D3YT47_DREPO|nr:hypothetical protein DPMN_066243 [Dreissena polymorpha]